jgi:hypothetical protein
MPAVTLNFDGGYAPKLKAGEDFHYNFSWTDSNKVPIDKTSYTPKMQVRKSYGGDVILEFSELNSRISVDSNSDYVLSVSSEDSNLLAGAVGVYDFAVLHNASQEVIRLLQGEFHISPQVTL